MLASQAAPKNTANTNGIDTGALRATIDAVAKDPARGRTDWAIRSVWKGGTRSDHHVEGCAIGGQFIPRPFTIKVDEPHELCGTNSFANPQEYLLAGMNACMVVGYSAVAALMGIEITSLEIRTEGSIDLRGFLAISTDVPNGYPSLTQTVHITADASPERLVELHEAVKATSPNFYNITRAIPSHSRLVIDSE